MNRCFPFDNTPLPYGYDALEPFIDERTMHLHHDRHLQTYIDQLNALLEKKRPPATVDAGAALMPLVQASPSPAGTHPQQRGRRLQPPFLF